MSGIDVLKSNIRQMLWKRTNWKGIRVQNPKKDINLLLLSKWEDYVKRQNCKSLSKIWCRCKPCPCVYVVFWNPIFKRYCCWFFCTFFLFLFLNFDYFLFSYVSYALQKERDCRPSSGTEEKKTKKEKDGILDNNTK